ncbi:MAG: NAD(P)-dependent glycerol-3-phosphate dehydrogenase [Gammaproteobacteria bacterium]|nr:NAD(P)-dependent glycerol-3-phosphate dehydrogenase [Gammaproteobacteria bacterium]MDH3450362.1 NAD(P)-dependent glycerol-3-phosphate dehydrogenase [Gammaproteobacteria bacterium]
MAETVAVLGAGSWGTALAIQLARGDQQVRLWGHEPDHVERLSQLRENAEYLPGFSLADNIEPLTSLAEAVSRSPWLLIAIPSKGFRDLLRQLKPLIAMDTVLFWASKGFEIETGRLLHEVLEEELPGHRYGVISGPTFATEVARGTPAAIACAGSNLKATEMFAEMLRGDHFRVYTTDDIVGVELGGALKNVLAIAVGASDGLGFGANTRAALMTRGLSEIMQLGTRLGARRETLMGLAGLGDIILTCTDDQSRNRRFGLAIGQGKSVSQAEIEVGQTVEGLRAARAIYNKTRKLELDLPIIEAVYQVLYEGKDPRQAVRDLESRPQGRE